MNKGASKQTRFMLGGEHEYVCDSEAQKVDIICFLWFWHFLVFIFGCFQKLKFSLKIQRYNFYQNINNTELTFPCGQSPGNPIKAVGCVCVFSLSIMSDSFVTSWTVAQQALLHGIFQAGVLEWVAASLSRGSSRLRDQAQISCVSSVADGFFTC